VKIMKITWNGFLEECMKAYPNEICGPLFSKKPYSKEEEWTVYQVKNIRENKTVGWRWDKKDLVKVKKLAIKEGLTLIGNVHNHPVNGNKREIDFQMAPSKEDLKFARKYNDIIRIIIVNGKEVIHGIYCHDKFGEEIHIEGLL
jgi:proteasome lid subunit RPN8/RPN11